MKNALLSKPVYPAEAYREDMEALERAWPESEPDDPAGWWLWIFTCVAAGMLVLLFLGIDTIWTGPVQDHIEERAALSRGAEGE